MEKEIGKDPERKESINADDLKKKFKEQISLMGASNAKGQQLQQQVVQVQQMATRFQGAAESTVNMLAEIIGRVEAQKFAEETMTPKEEKKEEKKK